MKRNNQGLTITLGLVYLVGTIFHIWLFYAKGRASVFSTFFLYVTVALIAIAILNLLYAKKEKKEDYINFKLLIISTILFLFVGELTLRYVFEASLSYKEKNGGFFYISPFILNQKALAQKRYLTYLPNTTKQRVKSEFSYLDQFNSMGMREREISDIPWDSSIIRILGIGDSFTEGTGTHQDSTWLRILENRLNRSHLTKPVSTINGGNAGSDPIYDYTKLNEFLLPLNPDLVILSINYSDLIDISIRGGFERYQKGRLSKHQPWWEPFFASSIIFRGLMHVTFGYSWDLIHPDEKQEMLQNANEHIIEAVDRFKVLASKHHFKLLLVIHPLQEEEVVDGHSKLEIITKHYKTDQEVLLLNLLDSYLKAGVLTAENTSTYYWPLDGHHTPKGYQLWAETLHYFMVQNNVLENL